MANSSIAAGPRDFYVYMMLREPEAPYNGTPFYVGKGRGRRSRHHLKSCAQDGSPKANIIRRIHAKEQKVRIVHLADGLTEAEAFALEMETIARIGRHPNGPLRNRTDGGEGAIGWKPSPVQREANGDRTRTLWADPAFRAKQVALRREWWNERPEMRALISAMSKGKKKSAQECAEIRQRTAAMWANPQYREAVTLAIKSAWSNPERKARMGEWARQRLSDPAARESLGLAVSKAWSDPARRARWSASISDVKSTPEARHAQAERNYAMWDEPGRRESLAELNRKRWANPEYKATVRVALSKARSTEEQRAAQADRNIKMWSDPAKREAQRQKNKETWSDPDRRAKLAAIRKAQWADPAYRERVLAAQRAALDARKADRAQKELEGAACAD